jgi:hypothetical protein
MGAQAPIPTPPPLPEIGQGFHPSTHGNWAQWAAILVALVLPFVLKYFDRGASREAETFALRVDKRIDDKLGPAVEKIDDHIDKKVDPLSEKIDRLSDRVSRLEGPLTRRVSDLEKNSKQQNSLAKLIDPARVLATIRVEIQMAQGSGKILPVSDRTDYRNAVQALPPTAHEYWATVTAIINYESYVNQMSGEAPDPSKISRPCMGGGGSIFIGNVVSGAYSDCIVDMDTNVFENATFRDSVINYQGGPVTLANVRFINCRFNLHLASAPQTPAQNQFLRTLLQSPDQRVIKVSTHS